MRRRRRVGAPQADLLDWSRVRAENDEAVGHHCGRAHVEWLKPRSSLSRPSLVQYEVLSA